jgi:hypothetical protein
VLCSGVWCGGSAGGPWASRLRPAQTDFRLVVTLVFVHRRWIVSLNIRRLLDSAQNNWASRLACAVLNLLADIFSFLLNCLADFFFCDENVLPNLT